MNAGETTTLPRIGKLIQRLREEKRLTQKELAQTLSTSQSAIARIERGEQNVTTEMLGKIGRALNKNILTLSSGAMSFRVEGGRKLAGTIEVKTSKNSATALLAAVLLNHGKTTLKHMPRIEEVYRLIEVLQSIGVSVRWEKDDLEVTPPKRLTLSRLNAQAAGKTRSIIMFVGPLVHLFKSFKLPHVGGCKLGLRSIRPHARALKELGISIEKHAGAYHIAHGKLHAGTIVLSEASDTATENALMAAAGIPEETVIKYASANYQVQDLCFFLQTLGISVEGVGTSTLKVRGKKDINEDVVFYPSEDPTDAMFFLAAAATTGSSLTITRAPIEFLERELQTLEEMGFRYKVLKRYLARNNRTPLFDIKTFPSHLVAYPEKIFPLPYPGLNIDNLPFFAVIATQAQGQTLIHDWVYEKRALYYTELDKLGAETILADPHRIYINGKTPLQGTELICPQALRPATILLIGMLAAKGESILRNVYSINRGYEDLVKRLNSIGASIETLTDAT